MACSRLLFLAACAASRFAVGDELLSDPLGVDDECVAGAEGAECGLNAMQLRAKQKQLAQKDPAKAYQQCGGANWEGATSCVDGFTCQASNDYYSQCLPDGAASPQSSPGPSPEPEPKATMKPLAVQEPMPKPKERTGPLNPIVVRGNFLYDSVTGERFFAKGTSYNPRNDIYKESFGRTDACVAGDPGPELPYTADIIADEFEERWSADLEAIANLGANTVRLFNLDAGRDHKNFMTKAASLGIYVIIPLNSKDFGFLPAFPSPDCYTKNLTFKVKGSDGVEREYGNVGINVLSYGKQIVKEFSKYSNTLFFTVNNEFAMNDKNGFAGFQCVKALTRDIHRYQESCQSSMRRVPLIYSDYDMGTPDRKQVARYLTCALESPDDAIDVYGLNVYSWCDEGYPDETGNFNFQYSPYKDIRDDFKDFSTPVLFTEFGCTQGQFMTKCPYKGGRTWPDVKYMVGEEMGQILSGAIAYTYSMDFEERGLVLTPGFVANQTEIYYLDNYFALKKAFAKHQVSRAWDSLSAASCDFKPSKAAPLKDDHERPMCPSQKIAEEIQERRGTSRITNWHELPPAPKAPLSNVGQEECPANQLSAMDTQEWGCHKLS